MGHIILVAFEVETDDDYDNSTHSRAAAELALHDRLIPLLEIVGHPSPIESWWVAEDDRHDRSDLDSAVFVHKGSQREALAILISSGLSTP